MPARRSRPCAPLLRRHRHRGLRGRARRRRMAGPAPAPAPGPPRRPAPAGLGALARRRPQRRWRAHPRRRDGRPAGAGRRPPRPRLGAPSAPRTPRGSWPISAASPASGGVPLAGQMAARPPEEVAEIAGRAGLTAASAPSLEAALGLARRPGLGAPAPGADLRLALTSRGRCSRRTAPRRSESGIPVRRTGLCPNSRHRRPVDPLDGLPAGLTFPSEARPPAVSLPARCDLTATSCATEMV